MNWHSILAGTPLSGLRQLEVFVYHDGPRLLSLKNRTGQVFIALWMGDDESDAEEWVFVPVSPKRYSALVRSATDLRTALTEPEDEFIYQVRVPTPGRDATVVIISPADLDRELLPDPGVPLHLDEAAVPVEAIERAGLQAARQSIVLPSLAVPVPSVDQLARTLRRDVLYLALGVPDARQYEISARLLGLVIEQVQSAVQGFARTYGHAELNVVGTFPGSFGIQFASADQTDLMTNARVRKGLAGLLELSGAAGDEGRLREGLDYLTPRATRRFRAFLESLDQFGASARLEWGSPSPNFNPRSVSIAAGEASRAVTLIDRLAEQAIREFTFQGVLTGVNVRLRTFEIVDGHERIAGHILETAMDTAARATISTLYDALIEEVLVEVGGGFRRRYRLKGLRESGLELG